MTEIAIGRKACVILGLHSFSKQNVQIRIRKVVKNGNSFIRQWYSNFFHINHKIYSLYFLFLFVCYKSVLNYKKTEKNTTVLH